MRDEFLLVAKIVAVFGLVSSSIVAYHYETGVKDTYEPGGENFSQASDEIETYLMENGCSTRGGVAEHTKFTYLEVAYLTHEMSKNKIIGKFDEGICLSYQKGAVW